MLTRLTSLARVLGVGRQITRLGDIPAFSSLGAQAPQASEISLRSKEKRLDVSFTDGKKFTFPAELLRVESPSADTHMRDKLGKSKVVAGRRHVGILKVELVGHYAVRLHFDDLHNSGIYSWEYLYALGCHKFSRAKAYIRAVREYDLSRNPRKRVETLKKDV